MRCAFFGPFGRIVGVIHHLLSFINNDVAVCFILQAIAANDMQSFVWLYVGRPPDFIAMLAEETFEAVIPSLSWIYEIRHVLWV